MVRLCQGNHVTKFLASFDLLSPVFHILLAEDNPGDVVLFREALKTCELPLKVVVAEDGEKALSILQNISAERAGFRPDLIVLDVNLPKHSGDEVLRQVREDPALAQVPVIMLTSSASPVDKARATSLGASLYIEKSSDLEELLEIGKIVERMLKNK
jgi:chemotaxis family two-component system response regulator Rcp1